MATISHDPFARTSLERECLGEAQCDWCGRDRARVFRYGTRSDGFGARTNWHRGRFCNKSCHDSFHS